MTVRPTPSGQTPRPPIGRAQRSATPSSPSRTPEPATPAGSGVRRDDVQISNQARELQQLGGATPASGELSAGRLGQVLGRMNEGHYDSPEVQEQVVRRIARELP
jgi:hypothetical protein